MSVRAVGRVVEAVDEDVGWGSRRGRTGSLYEAEEGGVVVWIVIGLRTV